MPADDERLMKTALSLAGRGQGRVEPNPMVGCVLARGGRIVARGWHRRFGGPHAEIVALEDARRRSVDVSACDLYVTLEPCAHQGKTPPCTEALIAARPRRVVVAMVDPFPEVAGRGIARLRDAGIDVVVGCGQEQARRINEPFIKRLATGLPWVMAKWAQTLDGRIATRTGQSKWISGAQSRRLAHQLRARVDAIVVGIGTVLADDPQLTARDAPIRRVARRVVVDPHLRLPEGCALLRERPETVTLAVRLDVLEVQARRAAALTTLGVELVPLSAGAAEDSGTLSLSPLLKHLCDRHAATNVLVEGGSRLLGSLLAQGLVDQVLAFVAPRLLGDERALSAVRGLVAPEIVGASALELRGLRRLGDDVMLDYRVAAHPAPGAVRV